MTIPIVALVGRPNVGKSTLFNRLIGERRAIVEGKPGTTRDRLYGRTVWNGREFTVIDTAGLIYGSEEEKERPIRDIVRSALEQATVAIEESDAILFMVDIKEGLTTADSDVAEVLRRTSKPVILAVNKADSRNRELDAVEFYALNVGEPIPMSAYHGMGTGDVLDRLVDALPPEQGEESYEHEIRIAIVGRPNVGKSSLVNHMLGHKRSVVSPQPGTTRDSIDTTYLHEGIPITLIDTAGIRRSGKREQGVEKYSVLRAIRAIERCDVALLLIDAQEGVTAQDTHVAGMIVEANKSVAILVNKWDTIGKDNYTFNQYTEKVRYAFKFLDFAPLLFISAQTGQRVDKIIPLVLDIVNERNKRISTSQLNNLLRESTMKHPPTSIKKGAHLRLYYATQPQVAPPVFLFFANDGDMVHWSYARYLENQIREHYGFGGTPIKIIFRSREKER